MEQDQKYSQAFLNEDRSRELINVVVAFAVLETFFMLLFLASRTMNHTANGWDVYLMIPAYLFCFSHIIIAACKSFVDSAKKCIPGLQFLLSQENEH